MYGYQRRRTRGVDCHGGTTQVKKIRESIRDDAHRAPGVAPGIDSAKIGGSNSAVFTGTRACEYPRLRSAQRGGRNSCVLQRFPSHFQQQALLGVHLGGFAVRNLEEFRIEGSYVVEERTPARRARQRCFYLG